MSFRVFKFSSLLLSAALLAACAGAPAPKTPTPQPPVTTGPAPMPPIALVDAPLKLDVAYPREGSGIEVRDSNFIFGSTGTGNSTLTINGVNVPVKPNGAWLAYLPVPPDGVYHLQATKGTETASFDRKVRVPPPASTPTAGTRIFTVTPRGAIAARPGENIEVSFTGSAGGRGFLVLPNGQRIPMIESRAVTAAMNNAADFQTEAPRPESNATTGAQPLYSRYSGVLPAMALSATDTSISAPIIGTAAQQLTRDTLIERCAAAAAAGKLATTRRCRNVTAESITAYSNARTPAHVELVVGNDTVSAPLPLNITTMETPRVGIAVDRSPGGPHSDWRIRGRNSTAGPFHYFWPHGTQMTITGQRGNFYRVQLAGDLNAYVPVSDVQLLPPGTPQPGGPIANARFVPSAGYIDLRLSLPDRLPYFVNETQRGIQLDVYGGVSQVNFFQYGQYDPLIQRAVWSQPRDSVFRVNITLNQPVWGYDAFHDSNGNLVLRIRRPPHIDKSNVFKGITIMLDPGHGGKDTATVGPTRFPEAHANLNEGLALKPLLEAAGARVILTRSTNIFLELAERTKMAQDSNADILISLHNNAFPDGVNPFVNAGTSTYYYHPQSVDLAQDLLKELIAELGLKDIGYGRADLALVRPTWMPASLTETSFMMIPEQEAGLKNPEWLNRIARAHMKGIEDFLKARAAAQP